MLIMLARILLLFFILQAFSISFLGAIDILRYNQSLSGNQTLVSGNGTFVLGFFRIDSNSNYYLGIWFNNLPQTQLTVVWVANRESPITDPTTVKLRLSDDGNLVLSQFTSLFWSTNITSSTSKQSNSRTTTTTTAAVLKDNGNFVLLKDGLIIWQSLDHPANVWLPGGKLGMNKLTKQVQKITSWKTNDDPSPGDFSLSIDPNGSNQFFWWNSLEIYWSSGLWSNGIHFFSSEPALSVNEGILGYEYVSNERENYYTYWVKDGKSIVTGIVDTSGHLTLQKQILGPNGREWVQFWSEPRGQCVVYGLCGSFGSCHEDASPPCSCIRGFSPSVPAYWNLGDQAVGCKRNTALQCSSNLTASTDRFYEMNDMAFPEKGLQKLALANTEECKWACLKNCSCIAYSYNTSCMLWYRDMFNLIQLHDGTGNTIYIRVAASDMPSSSKYNKARIIGLITAVISMAMVVACLAIVCKFIVQRRKISRSLKLKAVDENLVLYSYSELKEATKNFSDTLGKGGFGSVFKGELTLPDTKITIAVKQLEGFHQGEKQFRAEVSTIGTIQHVNLVRLRGFCSEGKKRLLVYDYVPNGSLADLLFHNRNKVIDWNARYITALGIARGLAYLHEECRDCIIHCDIKPENILLDSFSNPKVADFGLAKLMGRDFSRVLTTVRGTIGYLAPEWISGIAITTKADVYSYGLMLFEIISGNRNSNVEGDISFYFPLLAASKLQEGDVVSLLDKRLEGEASMDEVARTCKVACWCIQDHENDRPTMGKVVQILEKVLDVEIPPVPRSLQLYAKSNNSIDFLSKISSTQASTHSSVINNSQLNSSASLPTYSS